MESNTVPCKYCGEPTQWTDSRVCEPCYQVTTRLAHEPEILERFVERVRQFERKRLRNEPSDATIGKPNL